MARPKGKKLTVRSSISLDPADHAELMRMADENDLSVAWLIRKAVAEFIMRNADKEQPTLPLQRRRGGGNAG